MKIRHFILSLGVAAILLAQDSGSLGRIREQYQSGEYSKVIQLVKADLAEAPQQPGQVLTEKLKLLALSQASLGQGEAARSTYASLLLIDPAFRFSEGEVSPKLRNLFLAGPAAEQGGQEDEIRYLIREDVRSRLVLQSILWPGLGQIHAGQSRGYFLASAFGAGIVGSLLTTWTTAAAHSDYLTASGDDAINAAYDTYNRSFHRRNNFWLLTGLIYSANILDILFIPFPS